PAARALATTAAPREIAIEPAGASTSARDPEREAPPEPPAAAEREPTAGASVRPEQAEAPVARAAPARRSPLGRRLGRAPRVPGRLVALAAAAVLFALATAGIFAWRDDGSPDPPVASRAATEPPAPAPGVAGAAPRGAA